MFTGNCLTIAKRCSIDRSARKSIMPSMLNESFNINFLIGLISWPNFSTSSWLISNDDKEIYKYKNYAWLYKDLESKLICTDDMGESPILSFFTTAPAKWDSFPFFLSTDTVWYPDESSGDWNFGVVSICCVSEKLHMFFSQRKTNLLFISRRNAVKLQWHNTTDDRLDGDLKLKKLISF